MKISAPRCRRSPSQTPSPTVKPASKIDTLASSRGVRTPLSDTSTDALRGSSAKSWLPGMVADSVLGDDGAGGRGRTDTPFGTGF